MSTITNYLKNENFNSNTLISFFQRIEPININAIINHSSEFENTFTFFNSRNKINFIAIEEVESKNIFFNSLNRISNVDKNTLEKFPLFVGYKKFISKSKTNLWDDFSDNKWYIPKFIIAQNDNDYFLIHNFLGNMYDEEKFNYLNSLTNKKSSIKFVEQRVRINKSDIDELNWKEKVKSALNKINKNELEKVVIARKVELELLNEFNLLTTFNQLLNNCNDCIIFSVKESNSIFFGATPEKLFSINKNIINTEALAGSIERSKNETEDAYLGNQLLRDPKELNEQKKVLDYILSILSNYSSDIKFNEIPFIKKLNSVQHLQTKINATISSEFEILKFLNEIHPTPAVCGLPKEGALEFIYETEDFDRGLYAGVIGWFNNFNVGEFYVGIRSALQKENKLNVFAGCGIVEGSIPEKEFFETEIKLKPILSLFSL